MAARCPRPPGRWVKHFRANEVGHSVTCKVRTQRYVAERLSWLESPLRTSKARGIPMDRTDVNPWEWSKAFRFSQAVEVRGAERILVCSGQTGIEEDGSPPSSSNMGDQVQEAFENFGVVLQAAGLGARRRQGQLLHDGRRRIGNGARITRVGVLRRQSPGLRLFSVWLDWPFHSSQSRSKPRQCAEPIGRRRPRARPDGAGSPTRSKWVRQHCKDEEKSDPKCS